MNTIIHIFKKDFAKLKVLLSVWLVLIIVFCVNGSVAFLDSYKIQLYLPDINALIVGLQYLMVVVIVPMLIQDDPLVGSSAFWLTRPIARNELLIEKMAFLTLFLLILPLCAELFVLVSNGVPFQYLVYLIPEFLYRQLQFIVPVLLIASLTQKFSKYALVGIVILVVWYLINLVTSLFPLLYNIEITEFLKNKVLTTIEPHNTSLEWSINLVKIVVSALICGFIIHNQFINRDSKRTIKWIIYGFTIVMLVNKFWSLDYLNIEKLKPKHIAASQSLKVVPEIDSVWAYDGYDFGNKHPEENFKDIHLIQNVEGLPKDQFAMVDKLKNPRLTYKDGKTLTWDDEIDGRSYSSVSVAQSKFINPIQSVLLNTRIVNKYRKAKSHSVIMKVTDANYDKYRDGEAAYSADARYNVYKYSVTSVLPLKVGAKEWIGNKQFVMHDVIKTTFGVKIVIGEKKVDLALIEGGEKSKFSFNNFGFLRDMGYKQPFYILRNKKTGEAFVPEIALNVQISEPKLIGSAILKTRICQFLFAHDNDRYFSLPTIDKEWLKDAELVRLESQKVGYFNILLKYDKILLNKKKNYVEKDGIRVYYFNTGEVKREQPDVNIKQETVSKTYYKTGDLKGAWVYKNGELNGVSKTYYQSGELFYEYFYVDGELDGVARKYNKVGELIDEKIFRKGDLIEQK